MAGDLLGGTRTSRSQRPGPGSGRLKPWVCVMSPQREKPRSFQRSTQERGEAARGGAGRHDAFPTWPGQARSPGPSIPGLFLRFTSSFLLSASLLHKTEKEKEGS